MARTAILEVTISGATGLKNTKRFLGIFEIFGKMSPTLVLSIPGTSLSQKGAPALNAGASPTWNETFIFLVPSSVLRQPKSAVRVEIYDSPELTKSLGHVDIPLARPIAHHDLPWEATQGVMHKVAVRGCLSFSVTCGEPSLIPPCLRGVAKPLMAVGVPLCKGVYILLTGDLSPLVTSILEACGILPPLPCPC